MRHFPLEDPKKGPGGAKCLSSQTGTAKSLITIESAHLITPSGVCEPLDDIRLGPNDRAELSGPAAAAFFNYIQKKSGFELSQGQIQIEENCNLNLASRFGRFSNIFRICRKL